MTKFFCINYFSPCSNFFISYSSADSEREERMDNDDADAGEVEDDAEDDDALKATVLVNQTKVFGLSRQLYTVLKRQPGFGSNCDNCFNDKGGIAQWQA